MRTLNGKDLEGGIDMLCEKCGGRITGFFDEAEESSFTVMFVCPNCAAILTSMFPFFDCHAMTPSEARWYRRPQKYAVVNEAYRKTRERQDKVRRDLRAAARASTAK